MPAPRDDAARPFFLTHARVDLRYEAREQRALQRLLQTAFAVI